MRVRAKANGNVRECSDEEAAALLATGIYEPDDEERATTKRKDVAAESAPGYKRRDLRPKP